MVNSIFMDHPNSAANLANSSPSNSIGVRPSTAAGTFNSSANDRPGSGLLTDVHQPQGDNVFKAAELPDALEKLEQKVASVETAMEQLRELAVLPQSELTSVDGERDKIRSASHSEAQRMAISYLMSYRDLERRFESQRRRMDVLESRTARMESLFSDQIQLNKEIGAEAVAVLRRFVDDEKRLIDAYHQAQTVAEKCKVDAEHMQGQMKVLEKGNNDLRIQMETLIQEKSDVSKQLLECQAEMHDLQLVNGQLLHEQEAHLKLIEKQNTLIDELREKEQISGSVLTEKEEAIRRFTLEREEMESQLAQERQNYLKQQEQLRQEHEKRLEQERVEQEKRLQAEQRVEQDKQQSSEKTLQKAAEAHRKMEQFVAQITAEKQKLEENLDSYKRRFVAELNRELTSMFGTRLNTALMDVLVRLNCEQYIATGSTNNQQNSCREERGAEFTFDGPNEPRQTQPQMTHQRNSAIVSSNKNRETTTTGAQNRVDSSSQDQFMNGSLDSSISAFEVQQQPTCSYKLANKPVPAMAGKKGKENLPMSATIKKRPIQNVVSNSNNGNIEPFVRSNKQVPIAVLAQSKPWRPPCQAQPFNPKQSSRQKRQQPQVPRTPPNVTLLKQIKIGAPMYTSTPAKKRQFPAFQL